ncbi:MAG TPA: beta-ketoacyl synthase N-terminal-like domain-containing protein, partial [Thermoanaerobaculia bacterium]|nr:beta-ketoacyl synthase N-terminal-like domain-containing protein [Thermoanaerobaculia bacterium]
LVPAALVVLAALPLTANGKIDRAALPPPAAERAALATPYAAPSGEIEDHLAALWREVLALREVGADDNFFDLGGHSLLLAQVHERLLRSVDPTLPIVDLFHHPTVRTLAAAIARRRGDGGGVAAAAAAAVAAAPAAAIPAAPPAAAPQAPRPASRGGLAIAVIGMSGRFPGAPDLARFWENLRAGVESVSRFTTEELAQAGVDAVTLRDPNYVRARAVLADVDLFDAAFFGYTPRDAQTMDPQHRIFLELAWEALEDAGYCGDTGRGVTGVYAGASQSTHSLATVGGEGAASDAPELMQHDPSSLPTRVSYKLDLKGPSLFVATACSTSLVAVHMACQSLRWGEVDMALAGGISATLPQVTGYLYHRDALLAADGYCRPFDSRAAGTLPGSGAGVVVLKRLEDALADGDAIRAVIRGSAVNNDGAVKVGFTAPSVDGQAEVIRKALAVAAVEPESISYVEAHGTGTALGDPIEIAGLTQAFREAGAARTGFCAIGSVKGNLGHLDAAAGVTGLIKTVLALEHREIPPSLHFLAPNPKLDLAASPVYVNARLRAWDAAAGPRRAGVSSFGIGGTNAHLVLEEAPAQRPGSDSRPCQLLTLSAKTAAALEAATDRLAEHLRRHPALSLPDAAFTLQLGRRRLAHRRAVVCRDPVEAVEALARRDPRRLWTASGPAGRPVIFLFPGGGSQHAGMGAELYAGEPAYRREIDRAAEMLLPLLGEDPRRLLYPAAADRAEAEQRMRRTDLALPALFMTEHALARLLISWGIRPQALIGHSLGEYVAACLAGVLPLADALALVALRGRLIAGLPQGSMLSVPLPEAEVLAWLPPALSLAAVNAPSSCLVAGAEADVARAEGELQARGLEVRRVAIEVASHSALVEPVLDELRRRVAAMELRPPAIPYLSNVTGTWIRPEEATDPGYWARHLRQTVRFAAGMEELLSDPARLFVEVGPGHTLSTLGEQCAGAGAGRVLVPAMRHPRHEHPDLAQLLAAVGRLWAAGAEVSWGELWAGEARRRLPLPTYPFERRRFRVEGRRQLPAAAAPTGEGPAAAALDRHPRPELDEAYAAPHGAMEQRLAEIWSEALGLERVGVGDNFFDLGGTSVTCIRIVSSARAAGLQLATQQIFDHQTIA